ncbi:MAG TPA: PAS domain-containing protein, partial [Planctomycetia bacterium]|nr:PAS domain-containing protein [Planctomycetia bacterium]
MDAETELDAAEGSPLIRRLGPWLSEQSPQPTVAVEGAAHFVIYVNPAFARLVGRARPELVGRPFVEVVPPGAGNGCFAMLDQIRRTGIPGSLAEEKRGDGLRGPVYWSYSAWAIREADGRPSGVMIQVTDSTETADFRNRVTSMNEALMVSTVRQHELIDSNERSERERRALEAKMYQAQKLESLGILAGGIAHDLNNMLTPVLGFAELAKEALPGDAPAVAMLEQVSTHARRAADLVQQILAYVGKGHLVVRPVDLSAAVREMSGLLASAVSVDTDLVYE